MRIDPLSRAASRRASAAAGDDDAGAEKADAGDDFDGDAGRVEDDGARRQHVGKPELA